MTVARVFGDDTPFTLSNSNPPAKVAASACKDEEIGFLDRS
jgi:hypothetical protein